MKYLLAVIVIGGIIAGLYSPAIAHSILYQVENRGVSARVFYTPDDPASYSSYEIFGPGDKIPHQKGWTDKNGFVSFLPDKQGKWTIKVYGESEHGMHGSQVEIDVNKNLFMESFKKPLVAQYTKAFVGISFILAIFGLWALLRTRKREVTEDGSKPSGAP
jgi:nickel transport protein